MCRVFGRPTGIPPFPVFLHLSSLLLEHSPSLSIRLPHFLLLLF